MHLDKFHILADKFTLISSIIRVFLKVFSDFSEYSSILSSLKLIIINILEPEYVTIALLLEGISIKFCLLHLTLYYQIHNQKHH